MRNDHPNIIERLAAEDKVFVREGDRCWFVPVRQIRLLELKQREAELAIKLWSTVNDGKRDAGAGAGAGGVSQASLGTAAQGDAAAAAALPRVVSIIGVGDDVRATVLVPYDGQVVVTAGQTLPGGLRVSRISTAGVIVTDAAGRTFALGFGTHVPAMPGASVAASR